MNTLEEKTRLAFYATNLENAFADERLDSGVLERHHAAALQGVGLGQDEGADSSDLDLAVHEHVGEENEVAGLGRAVAGAGNLHEVALANEATPR